MLNKLLFVDVGTTGTNPETDYITELAVIFDSDKETLGISQNWFCNPPSFPDNYEKGAGKVTGLTKEFLTEYGVSDYILYYLFKQLLKKFINPYDPQDKVLLVGYNPRFDLNFLHALFIRNGDTYLNSFIYSYPFDVCCLKQLRLLENKSTYPVNERGKVSFKLSDVLLSEKINPEKAHSALDDIEQTRKLYYVLREEKNDG